MKVVIDFILECTQRLDVAIPFDCTNEIVIGRREHRVCKTGVTQLTDFWELFGITRIVDGEDPLVQ